MPAAQGSVTIHRARQGADGKDGRGIASVEYAYARSAEASTGSDTTPPEINGSWASVMPELTDTYPYLWRRETTAYTDGTSEVRYALIGVKGAAGKGISSAVEMFCVSSSDSSEPDDTAFKEASQSALMIPANAGMYLWKATVVTYSDSSTVTIGKTCLGTVSSFATPVAQYAKGTAGEVTGDWHTSVTDVGLEKGDFLWTRTRMEYAGGGSGYTDSINVGYWGSDGASGRGVSSVTDHYLATSAGSGVTSSTSGWTKDIQTITATNKYLWNYETTVYSDGTSADTDPHIIGVYGDTGPSGIIYRTSVWESGQYYRNDSALTGSGIRIIDICTAEQLTIYNSETTVAYQCVTSHASTSSIPLGTSGYWTKVTDFKVLKAALVLANKIDAAYINVNGAFIEQLTANDAFVTNLNALSIKAKEVSTDNDGGYMTMKGNTMLMFNSSGQTRLRISGGSLSTLASTNGNGPANAASDSHSKRFGPAVTTSPTTPQYTDSVVSFTASAAMVLTFPALTISTSATLSTARGSEVAAIVRAAWAVDGTAVTDKYYAEMNVGASGTTSATGSVALPRTAVNVSSGSHTVSLFIWMEVEGSPSYSSSDTLTISAGYTVTAKSVLWAASATVTEVANDGFQTALAANVYFKAYTSGSSPVIEMRNGNYGLRITSSGIQKMANGSTWTSASL